MGFEVIYFYVSIFMVLSALFVLGTQVYLKATNKTFFGQHFKKGTSEYERVIKIASFRNIVVVVLLFVTTIANLTYSISRILNFSNQQSTSFLLWFAPLTSIIFYGGLIIIMRNLFSGITNKN